MPKLCEFETCRCQASYGEFYGKPLRCKEHNGKYKLVSTLCQHDGCKVRPLYNYEDETKARFCSTHKLENMVNVKHKKCEHDGCKIRPHYNYEDETKARFCSTHKLENMVDIKHKMCEHDGCKIRPHYNYEDETKATFCSTHKLENMVDVKNKQCEHDGCKIRPHYNYEDETKATFCSTHKLENMVNVTSKMCEHDGCKIIPHYNYEDESTAIFCSTHKLENMVDVKHKKCKANFCLGTRANDKYKGYCANCYQNLFPNDPLSFQIRSKTKEIAVRDYINTVFEGFQHDKPLWTGNCDCTHRRRIDHRKLIGNTLLCIETDENQHKSYDDKDEKVRYDDLFMLHGGKFIYIRFNPDKFKNKNGKFVNPMLYTRLPILKEEIEKQIKRIEDDKNKELLEIIKLYYNE